MVNIGNIFTRLKYWRIRFHVFLSRSVGYVVIYVTSLIFVLKIWKLPFSSIVGASFSVLAIITALSALSFTMAPCLSDDDKRIVLYSGENFFHAAIFIIQAILLKYAGEAIGNSNHLELITGMTYLISRIIDLLSVISVVWATYTFLNGYGKLSDFFWKRHISRFEDSRLSDDTSAKD